ncbi:MAG: hypothetical protein LAN37_12095 [Acidobacteriia bacterium]|nr:hypothetical protein [Terriglobia bacterium]
MNSPGTSTEQWWFTSMLGNFFEYFADEVHIFLTVEEVFTFCSSPAAANLPGLTSLKSDPLDLTVFLRTEVTNGFPTVHMHSAVAMFAAWESIMSEVLVGWLLKHPEIVQKQVFAKVRIKFVDYTAMEPRERMRHLLSEVKRELPRSSSQFGTFKSLAAECDLPFPDNESDRRNLLELCAVRNATVHHSGIADSKFRAQAPWTNWKEGEKIRLSTDDVSRYGNAVMFFVGHLAVNLIASIGGLGLPSQDIFDGIRFPQPWRDPLVRMYQESARKDS